MSQPQSWNPQGYAQNARFVSDLGMPVVELLDPKPGERILDLGCGDGVLTKKISDLGCRVVGVDSSPNFIKAAQKLGFEAYWMDGQDLRFDFSKLPPFDAVFSNAALHWMKRPQAVIAGVWHALRPGGRFVGEFGGMGNIKAVTAAIYQVMRHKNIDPEPLNPWYYPDTTEYAGLLQTQGFSVRMIHLFPRPTPLPGDITAWLETFAQSFSHVFAKSERAAFLAEVREILKPILMDPSGKWAVDYVRLRFAADKPAASL